jgi:hypothetical protein
MNTNNRRDTYIDILGTKGKTPFGSILQILKGKVANPFISSKQKLMILDALRRQLDFVRPNTTHNPNTWWDEFMDLNNELKALAMSDDAYEEE